MYRNMLISVSCDWPTVKNVVTGNSSSKPDRTGRDGKFVKQLKMLNNSAYSRLGNKCCCCIHLHRTIFYGKLNVNADSQVGQLVGDSNF